MTSTHHRQSNIETAKNFDSEEQGKHGGPVTRRVFVSLAIGLACGLFAGAPGYNIGGRDLRQALVPALDLLAGRAPLSTPTDPLYVPSPLTIAPLGVLLAPFTEQMAAGLFMGLSCGWLAWSILRSGAAWRLLIFISPAVILNLFYVQYPVLLLALALSELSPLGLLIKPHIALPLVMSYRSRRAAWVIAFGVLGVSLIVYPLWPVTWLAQIRPYSGVVPVLLPFGFGLLLSVFRIKQPMGRLVFFSSILPMRGVYDQVAFMMIPQSLRGMVVMICLNWSLLLIPTDPARVLAGCYIALAFILAPLYTPLRVKVCFVLNDLGRG